MVKITLHNMIDSFAEDLRKVIGSENSTIGALSDLCTSNEMTETSVSVWLCHLVYWRRHWFRSTLFATSLVIKIQRLCQTSNLRHRLRQCRHLYLGFEGLLRSRIDVNLEPTYCVVSLITSFAGTWEFTCRRVTEYPLLSSECLESQPREL